MVSLLCGTRENIAHARKQIVGPDDVDDVVKRGWIYDREEA